MARRIAASSLPTIHAAPAMEAETAVAAAKPQWRAFMVRPFRDGDLLARLIHSAVVVGPGEVERARRVGGHEEREVRVGRNGTGPIGADHLAAVVAAGELVEDLARDEVVLGV